ncbi:hypothetical protein [Halopiger xanaduensis]|uniref:PGF-CTERM sorting domain-containing protein n=1 Tax=Halopiger xanaduensis (strain DSM 18323 / JCM 14033 / SH-6) TaxID=797210 RepID=F8DBX6_HALXS|nr:hypothetical protein [Halopiger xanaduensis]AEH35952.1 hypothetical protein Halxa_1319 [Halopiger xanaduensis SH-6]
MTHSFRTLVSPSTAYVLLVAWATVILCLSFGLVAVASAQGSGPNEIENSTIETTENTSYVELDIEFASEFANNSSTETVDFESYNEEAWQVNGTEPAHSGTLNGTVLEVSDDIVPSATYSAELNQSGTTVDVSSDDFADNGTVDLSTVSSDSITSDDEVLSLTLTADPVVSDSVTGATNDTVTNEYTAGNDSSDYFELATEYRVLVTVGNESNIESGYVAPDDASIGGGFFGNADGSDGSPGFGAGVAVAAIATAGAAACRQGGR